MLGQSYFRRRRKGRQHGHLHSDLTRSRVSPHLMDYAPSGYARSAAALPGGLPGMMSQQGMLSGAPVAAALPPEGEQVKMLLGATAQAFGEVSRALLPHGAGKELECMLEFCGVFIAALQCGLDMVSQPCVYVALWLPLLVPHLHRVCGKLAPFLCAFLVVYARFHCGS